MPTTQIAIAQPLMPAYNPIKFIYDSTNKNLQGFKYIFDIYESGTLNKIAEYRVMPTYGTGYGEVDLSKLLQAQVSYDLNLTNTSAYNATNSHYKYDVKVGEEYLTTTTYVLALTQYLTAPYVGNVQINVANTFLVGDQINITQNAPGATANPNLEGLFTVVVANPLYIVVSSPWATVTATGLGGAITYADGRKTITRNIITALNKFVFNGAIRWVEWPAYDYDEFMLNNFQDRFLTNLPPSEFYATLSQDLWVNAVANGSPTPPDTMFFQTSDGDTFEKNVTAVDHVSGISIGPNNYGLLSVVSGALPMIKPTTEWYTVRYERNGFPSSKQYKVNIDRRVRTVEHSILFLDRMGSWGSFAFTGRAYTTGNVTREQFNKDVPGYVETVGIDRWLYETTETGMTNTYISTDTTIALNTDWMNETMAMYFTELISSPNTYIKLSNYDADCEAPESAEYVSCTIVTSTFEEFKQRNKNLIKQSIVVKLANNNIVNS
jgi:hypothetical protein